MPGSNPFKCLDMGLFRAACSALKGTHQRQATRRHGSDQFKCRDMGLFRATCSVAEYSKGQARRRYGFIPFKCRDMGLFRAACSALKGTHRRQATRRHGAFKCRMQRISTQGNTQQRQFISRPTPQRQRYMIFYSFVTIHMHPPPKRAFYGRILFFYLIFITVFSFFI